MAEGAVVNQDPNILNDFDLDSLLQGFGDEPIFDLDLDLFPESWVPKSEPSLDNFQSPDSSSSLPSSVFDAPPAESGSPDSVSSFVNYVEKILMDDDDSDDGEEVGDFFSGVIVDGSDSGKSKGDTPEACDASAKERPCKEEKEFSAAVAVVEKNGDFHFRNGEGACSAQSPVPWVSNVNQLWKRAA